MYLPPNQDESGRDRIRTQFNRYADILYKLSKKYGGMAGKTGTVQVKRITLAQREQGITKNIDRPWEDRDHALFVAYAPLKDPRYAISVVVEHGGSGSATAAPVARDILAKTIAERGLV